MEPFSQPSTMTLHLCRHCGERVLGDSPQRLCPACTVRKDMPDEWIPETKMSYPDREPAAPIAPAAAVRLKYFGDYELLHEIARGGMGIVWKARQSSLQRDVAIKMIRAGALASSEEVERFLREAKAAANLQHPNIVAIHEIGLQNGQHYLRSGL